MVHFVTITKVYLGLHVADRRDSNADRSDNLSFERINEESMTSLLPRLELDSIFWGEKSCRECNKFPEFSRERIEAAMISESREDSRYATHELFDRTPARSTTRAFADDPCALADDASPPCPRDRSRAVSRSLAARKSESKNKSETRER